MTLWHKNTPASKTVFNNEACLGEVEEANAASDMKFGTLDSEIESLKKEIDRLEGFSRRDNLRFFGLGPETPRGKFSSLCQKSGSGAERRTESNQTLDRRRHFQNAPHRTVSNRRPPSDDGAVLEVEG